MIQNYESLKMMVNHLYFTPKLRKAQNNFELKTRKKGGVGGANEHMLSDFSIIITH